MAWKKASEELNTLHADMVAPYPCDKRQMFGFQMFFVNDNMFTGVYEEGIMMRLSEADRIAVMRENDEAVPFSPMGRTMKEYVYLPESLLNPPEFAEKWIAKSHAYVSSLPPKLKKAKKASKAG